MEIYQSELNDYARDSASSLLGFNRRNSIYRHMARGVRLCFKVIAFVGKASVAFLAWGGFLFLRDPKKLISVPLASSLPILTTLYA